MKFSKSSCESTKTFDDIWLNFLMQSIFQFLLILAEKSACCTIWAHASHHRHIFFDSVQPLLALSEQRAWCTFFSLLLSASLLRCGLMVSSPEPWASSGGRLPEAFFLVSDWNPKVQKFANLVDLVKSCQKSIYLQKPAWIQPRTGLSKFAKNYPKVRQKKLEKT